ncbi:hypothetical protein [Niabella hibiscisoli]|uniref:hypothetical protein n=1 Tax=Niabella hibiscisoli TaxID=1825928 RepID=UPI001F0D4585|nr:hypothetical protein [Niabella hibiscisoli]MCH5718119.1 hypothetical protein [Niabella hibiscisoli]
MTSIYDPSGKQTACTIIEAGPCVVTQVKTKDTDGYDALQVSYGDKKESRTNQAEKTTLQKLTLQQKSFQQNFVISQ